MNEEEQEKLYELFFKDTKNKLEETIEEQQNKIASLKKQIKLMQSCDLAKVIKKQQKEIEKLNTALMKSTLKIEGLKIEAVYNNDYISKDKIRERIKINEELIKEPSNWKYAENETRNFKIENMCLEELLEENNKCK